LAKKDYKADSNIFKFIYDSLIEKVKVEERIERDQKELEERLKQQELDAKEREREHEEARKKQREQTGSESSLKKQYSHPSPQEVHFFSELTAKPG